MPALLQNRPPYLVAGLLAAAATVFSLAFACAAPFAALAALAARYQPPREALLSVGLAWIANQAIGYGLLGYPHDANSYGWGLAIGIAALAGGYAAVLVNARLQHWLALPAGFVAAFAAYQAALWLGGQALNGWRLADSDGAFSLAILTEVLRANLIGFAVLLAGWQMLRLLDRREASQRAA